ncbi:MAG: helix-turn-helix domain-containing protein [bacterium]
MDLAEHMSKIVRFHRQKSGLTQLGLANLAGVGKTVIFDIEKGKKTIKLSTLIKVLNVLNIRLTIESPLMKSYREENEEG